MFFIPFTSVQGYLFFRLRENLCKVAFMQNFRHQFWEKVHTFFIFITNQWRKSYFEYFNVLFLTSVFGEEEVSITFFFQLDFLWASVNDLVKIYWIKNCFQWCIIYLNFFRRIDALLWEIRQLRTNASKFNEQGSGIVLDAAYIVKLLTKFIRFHSLYFVAISQK